MYAAMATYLETAGCNSGIIDLGDHTLVFDTSSTLSSARELRLIAESLTGRPASYVINSHPHPDHVNGNVIFADHATLYSSEATKAYMEKLGHFRMEKLRIQMTEEMNSVYQQRTKSTDAEKKMELDAMLNSYEEFFAGYPKQEDLRIPDITYEQSCTFEGSKRKVELYTWGGAHFQSRWIAHFSSQGH